MSELEPKAYYNSTVAEYERKKLYDAINAKAEELTALFDKIKPGVHPYSDVGDNKALARHHVEYAVFRASKAIDAPNR